MKIALPIALLMALISQDGSKAVKLDDFEGELSGWTAMKADETGLAEDGDAKLAITRDAGQVKAGKGSLSYTYLVEPKTAHLLAIQRPLDLAGMKSLRLWVKCSKATAVLVSVTETGGASYQASATVSAGAWQEIAVNLDELVLDDPSKDTNGKLDLDQVGSIHLLDVATYMVNFIPDVKGSRTLWLDDVGFSAQALPLTSGKTQVTRVAPVFLVDSFETSIVRWFPISVEFADAPKFNLFDAPVTIDRDAPTGGGKQSLRFAYPRREKKAHGILRNVEKNDLSKVIALDLFLKTSHDGTWVVSLEEKDGSRYQKMVELKSADGWKSFSFPLSEFTLADDSQDDNGKLDPDQIKQIGIADLSSLLGGGEAEEVRLSVDQVQFLLGG